MVTKTQKVSAEQQLSDYLFKHFAVSISEANNRELYEALAFVAQQTLYENRSKTFNPENRKKKVMHYMSIEFLVGKNLKNNLWNLGLEKSIDECLKANGKDLDSVYAIEKDAGLGNGGLGRLAACYLDSLAKLGYQAYGHSIKYEYGLFNQKIVDGKQIETPDEWLDTGNVWLEPREDESVEVVFNGHLKESWANGKMVYDLENPTIVHALPYDMMFGAYGSNTVSTLRLWEAKARYKFDIKKFDQGEFAEALAEKNKIEAINKVLYPSDNNEKGANLRIIQQYFLVSAAMQSILKGFFKKSSNLSELPKLVAVHTNDTHPAMCIPELMRLLMDVYGYGWDESWKVVQGVVSYTNHTILSEALEVKSIKTLERLVPRIAMIIKEMDRRFRIDLGQFFKNDYRKIEQMAIVSGNNVYMANLSIYAAHAVNGVAKIHTNILKSRLFSYYAEIFPNKFKNITNGVTHRRWLAMSNPKLDELITSLIGDGYYSDANELQKLDAFVNDKAVLNKLAEIKFENKKRFSDYVFKTQGEHIDPHARFDVQVKRIHEYKRQLMNVLRIIYLCNKIRENPEEPVTPQVFIFAGKAAAGYAMAKRIIKLINELAEEVNADPVLAGKIKVLFVENYSVTVSELLMPATEVTQQISLAGREASGTGNMKAVMNGALMHCTVDGANIEIADACGHENHFEFGLLADDVEKIKARGYNATDYYISSPRVRSVIDKLNNGVGSEKFPDIVDYLLGHSERRDAYLCLADFDSYIDSHYRMDKVYADQEKWNQQSLHSIASMGFFSSDRAIEEYASKVWKMQKNED